MAAPRRISAATGLILSPILLVICAATLIASTYTLALFFDHANTRDLAASIEKGALPDADYVEHFVSAQDLDAVAIGCGDTITRAVLTVTLTEFDAATRQSNASRMVTAQRDALQAVKHRLACDPLDGNAWLRLAMINSVGRRPSAEVVNELRLSYWSAPSESWVIEARLPFATNLLLAGAMGFQKEYLDDLRLYASYQSTNQVAATYVGTSPTVRLLLRPLIEGQPGSRKKAIVAEIDRLGVDFKVQ